MKEFDEDFEDLDEQDEQQENDFDAASGEKYEHWHFVADKKQGLMRIDKYIVDRVPHTSRTKIRAAADAGFIMVNGEPVKQNYRVRPDDDIRVMMSHPKRDQTIYPEDIPLDIVYEDDDVLVVNKPAGMVVHPGHGNYDHTLVNALAFHLKDLPMFSNPEDTRPGLVHRIDKDTSGLLVIAKTDEAKMSLAKQFFNKTTSRTYVAIVWGTMESATGTIRGNIARHPNNRLQMEVYPDGSDIGKHAVTHYRVLEELSYISVIECKLETGRTHQIRAHMKHIGHPLFNDERYGGDKILKGTTFQKYKLFVENCFDILPRQALHAKTLGFEHPRTGEYMEFDSQVPSDITGCIERWRKYLENR